MENVISSLSNTYIKEYIYFIYDNTKYHLIVSIILICLVFYLINILLAVQNKAIGWILKGVYKFIKYISPFIFSSLISNIILLNVYLLLSRIGVDLNKYFIIELDFITQIANKTLE